MEWRFSHFIDGRKSLAVPAPRSKELDQRWLAGLENEVVEVVGCKILDCRSSCCTKDGQRAHEELCQWSHVVCMNVDVEGVDWGKGSFMMRYQGFLPAGGESLIDCPD